MDDGRYYRAFAAAFARGKLGLARDVADADALAQAQEAGLRLHHFKRNAELPRVRRVLGVLRGLSALSMLDIGSGRGTFLWPLLDALPHVDVTAVDRDSRRAADLAAVRRGGLDRLTGLRTDATALPFGDTTFEVVGALEVLEHVERPDLMARELVRVAARFVLVSVPSKEDDNPEHIQLFDARSLERLLLDAGARRVSIDGVRGHLVAVARAEP